MRRAVIVLLAAVLFLINAVAVQADTYEPSEPSKDILIDKTVGEPREVDNVVDYYYVDNLGTGDHVFGAYNYVWFKLRVKNTSNVVLHDVVVKDFEPDYFDLYANPGTLDGDTLVINAGDFDPGMEKIYYIRGRIYQEGNIPTGTTCVVNRARAEGEGVSDEDTSQFCFNKEVEGGDVIEKTVPVPTEVPSTGPEDALAAIWLATALGYVGLKLRKVS